MYNFVLKNDKLETRRTKKGENTSVFLKKMENKKIFEEFHWKNEVFGGVSPPENDFRFWHVIRSLSKISHNLSHYLRYTQEYQKDDYLLTGFPTDKLNPYRPKNTFQCLALWVWVMFFHLPFNKRHLFLCDHFFCLYQIVYMLSHFYFEKFPCLLINDGSLAIWRCDFILLNHC